jgi:prolycopene isomerase
VTVPDLAESYDAAVVGAGLGGLSAALALARAGQRVLLVDRLDGPGGVAHAFRRGPYTFDPAIHVTGHGFNIEFLDGYLHGLGIEDKVEFLPAENFYSVLIGGRRYTVPVGMRNVVDYLGSEFPHEADAIARYVETCADTTRESQAPPPKVALEDLDAMVAALPMLFKYRSQPLQPVLDEFLSDPEVKAVCAAHWPYMGLPPSRLAFMAFSGAWMALMDPGPVYPRGSFQRLSDALAEGLAEQGGQALFDTTVTRITTDGGRVTGIVLEDGTPVRAPVVVSNADAKLTYEQLVGEENVPASLMRRLRRMTPSISAFLLYSATTLDVRATGLAHETFVYKHWDHEETWRDVEAGRPGGMWLSFPTLHDPALAPEGEHIVIFTSLMPYDIGEPWHEVKERYTQTMIDEVEAVMPGYRDSITFVDSATPATFESYTLSQRGAIYGWENVPNQTMPKRLDQVTPVGGLYLAGHWTDPGTGSVRCLLSGLRVAAAVMGYRDPIEFLGTLHAAGAAR